MDHPCYKCGQSVEDGVPFCAHCGAPQIRVVLPEPLPVPAPAEDAAAAPGSVPYATASLPALPSQWSQALIASAIAGFIAALAISLGIIAGIGMLSAGFLAVIFYRRRRLEAFVGAAFGSLLGVISGAFAFLFSVALEVLAAAVLRNHDEVRSKLLDFLKQVSQRTTDPQVLATLDYLKSPNRESLLILFFLLCLFLAFVIFSGLGGALGGAIVGRRSRR